MCPSRFAAVIAFLAASSAPLVASAKNAIESENEKPVDAAKDSWLPPLDGSYQATTIGINGIVDVYPSAWSVKNGDTLGVRVSTTAPSFRTRIYRIGWYAAVGSRLVFDAPSTPGERQPFPPENTDTGLAEPNWHDSVTVAIGADWTPGHYAVRVTTSTGMDAFTHFIVRDDASPAKAAILVVDTQLTEQAYNPWPKLFDASGKQIAGKSTYSYNSAGSFVKASGAPQAVEVSLARPGGENWGLGIWRDWTVPVVQFLEKHGYDVAYANSVDLDAGWVLGSRKMWMDAGHDEYWTRGMWDNVAAGRNAGLNLAWFSGNDMSWQVRLEPGVSGKADKMVAYKIAAYPDEGRCGTCWEWGGDPEFVLALKAKQAGDTAAQIAHLRNVTYAWAGLKDWDPDAPSPVFPDRRGAPLTPPGPTARLAIGLEGLMNGPKLPTCPKSATADDPCNGVPWIVDHAEHWIYTGQGVAGGVASGLANGDRIPKIVGYEMDNARLDRTYPSRPTTQVILAHTDAVFAPDQASAVDFSGQFNAQYYQYKNGAHVFSAGTINWFWGVERDGAGNWGGIELKTPVKPGLTIDSAVTAITVNVLNKLQEGPGLPPTVAGPDGGVSFGDAGLTDPGEGSTHKSGGCSTTGSTREGAFAGLAVLASAAIVVTRRRRRDR